MVREMFEAGRLVPAIIGLAALAWFWLSVLGAMAPGQLGAPAPAPAPVPL